LPLTKSACPSLRIARGGATVSQDIGVRSAKSTFQYGDKILGQMGPRGWTDSLIDEAINSGRQVPAMNKATGDAAIRYVHPMTGQSVVVDSVANEVIHVGGPGFKYGPASGDVP